MKKLTERDIRHVEKEGFSGKNCARAIRDDLSLNASLRSVQLALSEQGKLIFLKRQHALPLSRSHKVARIAFGAKHAGFGAKWKKTIFSDEKKFNFDGPDGCQKHWHRDGTPKQACFKRHSGRKLIMIWGLFRARERAP